MCDSIEDFQSFGGGIYFYFFWLKYFSIVFGLMALLTAPIIIIISGWSANGFKGDQNYLVKTSLSNFLELQIPDGASTETIKTLTETYNSESRLYYYIFHGLDLGYTFMLWVAIIVFKWLMAKKIKQIQKKSLTVQKYTLLVKSIPQSTTLPELRKFFEPFGELVHVSGMFDFQESLTDFKDLAIKQIKKTKMVEEKKEKEKESKFKEANKLSIKIEKLNRIIYKDTQFLKRTLRMRPEAVLDLQEFEGVRLSHAYITFKEFETLQNVFSEFKREYRKNCCSGGKKDLKYYFKGKKLSLTSPDIPSNMNWHNIGYSNCKRFFRLLLIILLVVLLLIISTGLVLVFTSIRETSKKTLEASNDSCAEKISLATIQAMEAPAAEFINCFCEHQNKVDILNSKIIQGYCLDYLTQQGIIYAKQFGAAAMISILDIIFAYFIIKIIKIVNYKLLGSNN